MKAFAQWAIQSRLRITAAAFVCMAFPLLFWLGAALVGLVILRQGWREGRNIFFWAVLPAVAWAFVGEFSSVVDSTAASDQTTFGDPTPLMAIMGVSALAVVLRQTIRLDYTLYVATGLGVLMSFLLPALMPEFLALVAESTRVLIQESLVDQPELLVKLEPLFTPMISGVFAALHTLAIILSLLLARYWQGELYNPGGFGREFKELRLPVAYSAPVVAIMFVAASISPELVGIIPVLTVIMMLAGLSLLHGLATIKAVSGWMVPVYVALLLFGPYTYTLLIFLALLDSALNFRKRAKDTA